jgi:hypothetical protein
LTKIRRGFFHRRGMSSRSGRSGDVEAVLEVVAGDATEPLGERLGVAVVAAGD